MEMSTPLADVLLAHAPDRDIEDRSALERALEAAIAGAKAANPTVSVRPEIFVAFVAERLAPDVDALDALEGLRFDALYLTCASAHGDAGAIAGIERAYFSQVEAAVRKVRGPPALADEVRQTLRERLFMRDGERPPRITDYEGRASLARWIHAVALRAALDALRRTRSRHEVSADDALVDRAVPIDDTELELIKRRYSADFKAAIREAVATLEPEARNDLRFYYVDELTLDQLAALHQVAASTVSRRLAKAREQILDTTRAILRERLGLNDEDVVSILRLIGSRLELNGSALTPRSRR